jgi:hypothetical protein
MVESRVADKSEDKSVDLSAAKVESGSKRRIVSPGKKRRQFKSGVLVTDISSGSFKFVLLTREKDITVIHHYGTLDKNQLGIDSGDPFDLYRAGLAWIDANSSIRARDILVISSQLDFFIRGLELPLTKKSEVERAVRWDIDKQIPIKANDAYIKIGRSETRAGISNLTVGVVPRSQVNNWQFLDRKLVGVIPTPVSLIPMGPEALSEDLSYCYIFRDNSYLCIGFYSSGGLLFQHQIVAGPAETDFAGDFYLDPAKIVVELANSVEVFYSHFPDKRVAGIVLFMSSEEISELAPVINEYIVIDILPADKPENCRFAESCDPENLDFSYYPLLGAARIEDDDFIFLPRTLEDNILIRKIRKTVYYGLTTGIATIILLFMFMFAGGNIKKSRLKNIIAQKENIENSRACKVSREYLQRTSLLTSLENRLNLTSDKSSEIFTALEYLTPRNIFLNNVALNSKSGSFEVRISGSYEGELSDTDITILTLMDNLKSSGLEDIKLERHGNKLSGNSKTESFTVTGKFKQNE